MSEIYINYNEACEYSRQPTKDYWFWHTALRKGLPVNGTIILKPDMSRIKRMDIHEDVCNMRWVVRWECVYLEEKQDD